MRLMIDRGPLVVTSWSRALASHADSVAFKVNMMKRKVVAWTVFAILAVGTVIFVRWFLPWAMAHCAVATTVKPAQLDPELRQRLRAEETQLSKRASAGLSGPSERLPCLVLPVREGVGDRPNGKIVASPGNVPATHASPVRGCLELVPGGPPANVAEVSLDTGKVMYVQTDLYLPGDPPIAFTRVVMPQSSWNWKAQNQVYLPSEYITYPTGHRNPYTDMTLWLADTKGISFNRISKGTGYAEAVYQDTEPGSLFYNALAGWNGNGWDWDLPDGRTLVFPDSYYAQRPQQGSMTGLIEPSGASLTLSRDSGGNLRQVRSSDGRWMKLHYQGSLVVSIEDSAGDKATYAYDKQVRLSTSTNAAGETLAYKYNSSGALTTVENVKTHQRILSVQYASPKFPVSVQVDGGPVYKFSVELHVRDDRNHDFVVTCTRYTDNGCQNAITSR